MTDKQEYEVVGQQPSEEEAFEKAAETMWANTDPDRAENSTDGDTA